MRQLLENVTLDIFARVKVSLIFSETSYTIKTKINYFINEYMAICWITNTITLYNIPAHFIDLYLYTHNRFRKGDILPSVSFHAMSQIYGCLNHSVLTIRTQTGTCDTRSGDLVFFSAAFDEFSVFTKIYFYYDFVCWTRFLNNTIIYDNSFDQNSCDSLFRVWITKLDANSDASLAYWSLDTNKIQISPTIRQRKGRWKKNMGSQNLLQCIYRVLHVA